MSNRSILVMVDEDSMGNDWDEVDAFCHTLAETLSAEFPETEITVKPERNAVNGGRTEIGGDWDSYVGGEDRVYTLVKHRSEQIFSSGAYIR